MTSDERFVPDPDVVPGEDLTDAEKIEADGLQNQDTDIDTERADERKL